MKDAVLAEYVRSGVVESQHRGFLVALNADGSIKLALGDSSHLIFPRSTVKSFQAAAMVRNGLKLEPRLLALGASSHSGSPEHIAAVREILATVDLDESALQCMLDTPLGDKERRAYGDQAPTRIAMNCSGKHAAMLATCVKNGWSIDNYLDASHPLQVACREELESLSGEMITLTSTDGCGAPLFLISVAGLVDRLPHLGRHESARAERVLHQGAAARVRAAHVRGRLVASAGAHGHLYDQGAGRPAQLVAGHCARQVDHGHHCDGLFHASGGTMRVFALTV